MKRNGLELDVLDGLIHAIREQPPAARVAIRTRHRWDDGFAVDGYAREIESGGEITTRAFTFRTDWPNDVGGRDSGPTPGELALAALGGCVGMTYVMHAAARGVDIERLEVTIEAGWDVRALFELTRGNAALSEVKVAVNVRAKATDDVLDRIGEVTTRTSAVFNTLAHPVPIGLSVRRI